MSCGSSSDQPAGAPRAYRNAMLSCSSTKRAFEDSGAPGGSKARSRGDGPSGLRSSQPVSTRSRCEAWASSSPAGAAVSSSPCRDPHPLTLATTPNARRGESVTPAKRHSHTAAKRHSHTAANAAQSHRRECGTVTPPRSGTVTPPRSGTVTPPRMRPGQLPVSQQAIVRAILIPSCCYLLASWAAYTA